VESFESTLDSVYRADLVLLVVDASEPVAEMREKLVTSHDTLYERNEAPVVTVFNKIDRLEPGELAEKRGALSGVAPDPIAVSAETGAGVAELRDRVEGELPDWERERLVLPVSDDAMSLVSWVHDHGHVAEETYAGDQVTVDFEAKPSIVARARAKAAEIAAPAAEESA
jgi:GTP-binding protein HflX